MGRVAALVVALALLLASGGGLLAWRALRAVDQEQELRHQVVAARVFDELEGGLTALIDREEQRSFLEYRFYYLGDEPGAELRRSDLAQLPRDPSIVGYFQIDPGGALHSPARPRDTDFASGRGWTPDPRVAPVEAELRRLTRWIPAPPAVPPQPAPEPAPPTARDDDDGLSPELAAELDALLSEAPPATPREPQRIADTAPRKASATKQLSHKRKPSKLASLDTQSVESNLNQGAQPRALRKERQARTQQQNVASFQADTAPSASLAAPAPASEASPVLAALERLDEQAGPLAQVAGPLPDPDPTPAPTPAPQRARLPPSPAAEPTPALGPQPEVDVQISPFSGHLVSDERLVLYRDVHIGGLRHVQGLVLRLPELASGLNSAVLGQGELRRYLRLWWSPGEPGEISLSEPYQYVYSHRFGAPFDALWGVAELSPLPARGADPRRYVLWLSVALALVLVLGLGMVYRAARAVVHFAERRNNFVAAVSHELMTPLTAIRMYGEMLRDGMVPGAEKQHEYHDTITNEAERLSRLIHNVLELSRLEKGSRELQVTVGAVAPVLHEVVEVLRPHARELGFSLRVEADDALPTARYERDALLQVLMNLVENAMKFSEESDAREVVLAARSDGDGGVVLSVRDHGPGVPRSQLRRIFEAFYRGENENTRRTRGTGIGLALVRGLVIRMGGVVLARNHPEGGLEVTLTLRAGTV